MAQQTPSEKQSFSQPQRPPALEAQFGNLCNAAQVVLVSIGPTKLWVEPGPQEIDANMSEEVRLDGHVEKLAPLLHGMMAQALVMHTSMQEPIMGLLGTDVIKPHAGVHDNIIECGEPHR